MERRSLSYLVEARAGDPFSGVDDAFGFPLKGSVKIGAFGKAPHRVAVVKHRGEFFAAEELNPKDQSTEQWRDRSFEKLKKLIKKSTRIEISISK